MKNFKKIGLPLFIAIIFTVVLSGVSLHKAFADDATEMDDGSVSIIGFRLEVETADDIDINIVEIFTGNETIDNHADVTDIIHSIYIVMGDEAFSVSELDADQVVFAGDTDAVNIELDSDTVGEIDAGDNSSTATIETDNVSSSTASEQSKGKSKKSKVSSSSHHKISRHGHK